MPVPRKILIRVIGAPLLVAALCGILYLGHLFEKEGKTNIPLEVLLSLVAVLCLLELRTMCLAKHIRIDLFAPTSALMLLLGMNIQSAWRPWGSPLEGWGWLSLLVLLYVLCMLVFRYGTFTPEAGGLTLLCYGYLSLLVLLLAAPVPMGLGTFYLLFLFAAGKGSDMAAFVAGKSIGKHPMSPEVSPNKTWEGGIAGGLVGTGAGLAVILLTPLKDAYARVPIAALLFFSLIVTIAGQVGDLVKSAFKRWAGVKDSGRILPEFGGMLDMVDSFLLEAPVAFLGTLLLLKIFKGS
jgi:phosphatidate cytidylyltransferase